MVSLALRAIGGLVISALVMTAPESGSAQELTVIVNASGPIDALSEQEARQIFTARRLRWSDQRLIVAFNPREGEVYESLANLLTGRSARALGLLWLEAGFQEAAPAPVLVHGDTEMIEYVAANPGAVGYTRLSPRDLPQSVRAVHRLRLDGD